MITRDTKYEMPEIFREQDPNQQVALKQLERLADLVPLEFGADIFDWLSRPDTPGALSFPDNDPLQGSTLSNYTYPTSIYNYVQDQQDIQQQIDNISVSLVRYFQLEIFLPTAAVTTGDGKRYLHIPSDFNGLSLTEVHARVITAGTTGTTDIQIHNVTDAVDILSTKLTIDSGETGSNTAATAAVINGANSGVSTNDVIRVDLDAVSGTAPLGLIVTLGFS